MCDVHRQTKKEEDSNTEFPHWGPPEMLLIVYKYSSEIQQLLRCIRAASLRSLFKLLHLLQVACRWFLVLALEQPSAFLVVRMHLLAQIAVAERCAEFQTEREQRWCGSSSVT